MGSLYVSGSTRDRQGRASLAVQEEPSSTMRQNNALHQTGREGAAGFLRRRPVVEARPAGERECYPDAQVR